MEKKEIIWVIGDIHGMFDPLKRLITAIKRREVLNDEVVKKIIFIGDYIDYGPSSKEVLDLIMGLDIETVCLAGNHEDMLLHFYNKTRFFEEYGNMWFNGNGGQETVLSFSTDPELIRKIHSERPYKHFFFEEREFIQEDFVFEEKYMNFFKNLKYAHSETIEEEHKKYKFAFSHAALHADRNIENQLALQSFEQFHEYLKNNSIFPNESNIWRSESSQSPYKDYILIHGHTPTQILKHEFKDIGTYDIQSGLPFITAKNNMNPFRYYRESYCFNTEPEDLIGINIDTGAAYGGYLTAIGLGYNLLHHEPYFPVIQVSVNGNHRSWDSDTRTLFLATNKYRYNIEYRSKKQEKD
jgi:serine/threonine protein phosphatase 1